MRVAWLDLRRVGSDLLAKTRCQQHQSPTPPPLPTFTDAMGTDVRLKHCCRLSLGKEMRKTTDQQKEDPAARSELNYFDMFTDALRTDEASQVCRRSCILYVILLLIVNWQT